MCPNGDIVNNTLSTSFESLNAILETYVGHPTYEEGLEKWRGQHQANGLRKVKTQRRAKLVKSPSRPHSYRCRPIFWQWELTEIKLVNSPVLTPRVMEQLRLEQQLTKCRKHPQQEIQFS